MRKLHLRGRPANEGAWRLAWYIGQRHRGSVNAFCAAGRLDTMLVERLLSGEVIPGNQIGLALWAQTHGAVLKCDFQHPVAARWYDQPAQRGGLMAA